MAMRWHQGLLLGLVAVAAAPSRRADACSHPAFTRTPFVVAPADGAFDVPLNVVVRLHWPGGNLVAGDLLPTVVLHTTDGTEVATTSSSGPPWGTGDVSTIVLTVTPAAPLAPLTTYSLTYSDPNQGPLAVEVGSFTTGEATDEVAPATPVLASIDVALPARCSESEFSCCEPHIIDDVTIQVAPVDEPVVYDVLAGTQLIAGDLPAPLAGVLFCDEGFATFHNSPVAGHPAQWMTTGPTASLTVIARDAAGLVSPPLALTVIGRCDTSGIAIDAGPGGDGAGAAADAADGDEGCGCTVGGAGRGPGAWVALAAFALFFRRRRRP
jgi:MYXO-CTERM domain-containing protein